LLIYILVELDPLEEVEEEPERDDGEALGKQSLESARAQISEDLVRNAVQECSATAEGIRLARGAGGLGELRFLLILSCLLSLPLDEFNLGRLLVISLGLLLYLFVLLGT